VIGEAEIVVSGKVHDEQNISKISVFPHPGHIFFTIYVNKIVIFLFVLINPFNMEKKHRKKPKSMIGKAWHFLWHEDSWLSWIALVIVAFVAIKYIFFPLIGLLFATSHPIVAVVSSSMEHNPNFDDWWDSNTARCPYYDQGCSDDSSNNNCFYRCTQEEYYLLNNINKTKFKSFPFRHGFDKGDVMFLRGVKPQNIKVGDIIVFQTLKPDPIIHRVVNIYQKDDKYYFHTKGDNNNNSIVAYFKDLNEDGYYIPNYCVDSNNDGKLNPLQECEGQCNDFNFDNRISSNECTFYPKGIDGTVPFIDETEISEDQVKALGKAWFRIPWLGYIKIGVCNAVKIPLIC
ncbi:signal peptidase I, partial [Nanoarchaeota archaeon]